MVDAGYADARVALPLGAGLAARAATRLAIGGVPPQTRRAEQWMLRLAVALRGSPGQRLRILRSVSRVTAVLLHRRRQAVPIQRALLGAARSAARLVLSRMHSNPSAGTSTGARAARRIAARRAIINRVPVGALSTRYPGVAGAVA
jgi:hypothetical protein